MFKGFQLVIFNYTSVFVTRYFRYSVINILIQDQNFGWDQKSIQQLRRFKISIKTENFIRKPRLPTIANIEPSLWDTVPGTHKMIPNATKEKFEDPQNDSIWILSSTFIIFTMQSGK